LFALDLGAWCSNDDQCQSAYCGLTQNGYRLCCDSACPDLCDHLGQCAWAGNSLQPTEPEPLATYVPPEEVQPDSSAVTPEPPIQPSVDPQDDGDTTSPIASNSPIDNPPPIDPVQPDGYCGDGETSGDEECDGQPTCSGKCKWIVCG